MDASSVSMLWHWRSKPQGKMKRRVQDVRIPSSSRRTLDLSYNESTRLAMDSLLSQGLEGYQEVLRAEAEVDFLSELEKIYILENGRDGVRGSDPRASDDDRELRSLSAASRYTTHCSVVTADSDRFVTDVKMTDSVLDEPNVEVYFPSDCKAAGMKDTVRMFIRKSTMALAIVMDSFSDVELLCDLLEASRKRNVSIHLLLDHLNLNVFVSMWQDLKLNSINFPKLSVHSVDGQTYCTKTGRKLTGQIAETFIIRDWTEVLTGSFSFSWLSGQVHRNFSVVVKGSAAIPFHQEFYRLHSRSKPVPGFVTYISVPETLALYTTSHAAQNGNAVVSKLKSSQTRTVFHRAQKEDDQNTQMVAKMPVLFKSSKSHTQPPHREGTSTQMYDKPLQLYQRPLVDPRKLMSLSMRKPKYAFKAVCTKRGVQTNVEPRGKNDTHVSCIQSQLTSLAITTAAEKIRGAQESNPLHAASATHGQHSTVGYQSPFRTNSSLKNKNVGTESLFFQRGRQRLIKPLGIAAGHNTHRRHWHCTLNPKPNRNLVSGHPKLLPPSTLQTDLPFHLTHPKGHSSGLKSKIGTRRQDQPQSHHQSPLQSHPTAEAPGLKSSPAEMRTHPKHQLHLDSQLFSPGTGTNLNLQPHTSQQVKPTPSPNWMPQSHAVKPRPVARQSSFSATYGTGQQAGQRPFHSSMDTLLGRSKNMTSNSAGLKGADVTPNINKS